MPTKDPVGEAREALLEKASKLEVARQAILTQDLAELAAADREKVRRLEEKRIFGQENPPVANGDPVGDIIVCDDYRRNDQPRPAASRAWPMAAGIAMAGGLIAGAMLLPKYLEQKQQANPTPSLQTTTPASTITIQKKGFVIDLPGAEK